MVLVGVHDEPCGDSFGAQRVVVLEAFVVGDAVVEFAVDDERWGLEVFREDVRGLRLVFFEVFPWPDAQLLIEPEVAVVAELSGPVVDAGVADVGFVAVGVAVHPRDHVAAVAAASGVQTVCVDDAFFDEDIGDGLGVGEFARAEIAVDAAEEGLVKTRRAVIVHCRDHKALRSERLHVPAVMPGVEMRGVWAAVNVLQQRVFFLFVVVRREADEGLNGLAVPAFDGAALPFAERDFFEEGV